MRLTITLCLAVANLMGAGFLYGQAVPTATRTLAPVVGVTYNSFAPDYRQGRIQGLAVYAGIDASRYFGLEGVARRVDIITPRDIGEQTYLVGPRFRYRVGRFAPYAKVMGGLGVFKFQLGYNSQAYAEHHGVFAYGGGLDVSLSPHVVLRAVDYEGQMWPGFAPHGLSPSGLSTGLAYRF